MVWDGANSKYFGFKSRRSCQEDMWCWMVQIQKISVSSAEGPFRRTCRGSVFSGGQAPTRIVLLKGTSVVRERIGSA